MTTARCAYDRCQAGGVILPGAPRVASIRLGTQFYEDLWHPGCYDAEHGLVIRAQASA